MNRVFHVILVVILLSSITLAQKRHKLETDPRIREKIEQLEKIKLIETLEMDEETAIRFFARKNSHQNEIDTLIKKIDEVILKLDQLDKSERMISDPEFESAISDFTTLHIEIEKEKSRFISSLDDILNYNQIARFIVFQRKFRDQLKNALFNQKRKPRSE